MLADVGEPERQGLVDGLHRAGTQFFKLIEFIASHLPMWRNDRLRQHADAEDELSDQLCDYLNDQSRNVPGIESFKFQRETRDDGNSRRNLDIAAKPVGEWLSVGPRHYSPYDIFLPIECKRLPMPEPNRSNRDHREYLFDEHKSAGGVQRFKAGHHGANHSVGAMIGYVQQGNSNEWLDRINGWVAGLVENGTDGWQHADALSLDFHDANARFATVSSRHSRVGKLGAVDLKHLWIEM